MKAFLSTWQAAAFASAFFAAITAIFGKIGVKDINSDLATFLRTVVIIFILALLVTLRGEWKLGAVPNRSIIFLVLSAVATGFSWVCYYRALQMGQANRVAPIDKLSVVLVIIFASIFLKEAVTWKVVAGGTLVAAGAVLLAI